MKRIVLFILSAFFVLSAFAQYESYGVPLKFTQKKEKLRRSTSSFFVDLNADTTKISLESSHREFITGVTCPVDINLDNGQTFIENGYKVSRIGLRSENAKGISLFFDKFILPEGGKLFVYNPEQTIILGAFTSKNNNEENSLLIRPLASDSVVVEYQEPLDASFEAELHISLATHELRAVNDFLVSNLCSPHATHEEKTSVLRQSVCLLFMVGTSTSSYGSGALINNPEHKPYVYTAGHNIKDEGIATRTIYYFNYEVPAQDSTFQGSFQFSISGSKLLSRDEDVDFALVELNKMPPIEYRPYLAAWTRSTTPKAPFMCIQHPYGDVKKVSYTNSDLNITVFNNNRIRTYWHVKQWDKGVTEQGSSGSPLFDDNGYIIGELTGGSSFCNTPYNDYFCMFSAAWNYYSDSSKQLAIYLDPNGEDIMSMEGYNPYSSIDVKRISNIDNTDKISVSIAGKTPYVGHNSYKFTEFAEKFELSNPAYIYGTYIMPYKGKYNADVPIKVNVYSGVDKPEQLLSTAIVHPTEAVCSRGGNWSENDITSYKKREIYVPLNEPVLIEQNLFVSLQIQYENMAKSDTLLMASVVGKDKCTAYFYNDGWKSYNEHPYANVNLSMWVDPIVGIKSVATVQETEKEQLNYTIYPNPTQGEVFVSPTFNGEYNLYDISGNLLQKGTLENQLHIPTKGFYILELYPNVGKKETHKLICH